MLATKVRIVNRRGFMRGSPRSKGIVTRSAAIKGNATPSNPRVSPVKGVMLSSMIDATRPPAPEIIRVVERRVTREEKVKRSE